MHPKPTIILKLEEEISTYSRTEVLGLVFPDLVVLDYGLDWSLHHCADKHGLPMIQVSNKVLK